VEKLVALGGVEAKVPSSTATIAPVDVGVGNIIKSSSKGHLPTQSGKESTSQEPLTTLTVHTASQVVSTLAPPVTSAQFTILIPPAHVKTPKKRTATPSNMDEETSMNTKRVKKAAVAVTGENSIDDPVEQVVRQIQAVPREVGAIRSGLKKPSSSKVDKASIAGLRRWVMLAYRRLFFRSPPLQRLSEPPSLQLLQSCLSPKLPRQRPHRLQRRRRKRKRVRVSRSSRSLPRIRCSHLASDNPSLIRWISYLPPPSYPLVKGGLRILVRTPTSRSLSPSDLESQSSNPCHLHCR
jgi:hypothetical protein